jgi:hypothetical protein
MDEQGHARGMKRTHAHVIFSRRAMDLQARTRTCVGRRLEVYPLPLPPAAALRSPLLHQWLGLAFDECARRAQVRDDCMLVK